MRWLILVLATVAIVLVIAGTGRADFVLLGNDHLEVASVHETGILYDSSTADVVVGGRITYAYVNNDSSITVFDGYVDTLKAYDASSVDISGGSMGVVATFGASRTDIFDGDIYGVNACDTSSVVMSGGNISGYVSVFDDGSLDIFAGKVGRLNAYGTSITTFHGYDFRATNGLSLEGERVLSSGLLSGKWINGESWILRIANYSPSSSTIRTAVIPEPSTFALLFMAAVSFLGCGWRWRCLH